MDFDYWFSDHLMFIGKNAGKRGYGWPRPHLRWCTSKKIKSMYKFKTKDCKEYIGIAADEDRRITALWKVSPNIILPLVDWEITEADALEYCYSKGFHWEGHYDHFNRLSCWCCPLQGIKSLKILYNRHPDLWAQLVEMDKKSRNIFKIGYTLDNLTKRFSANNDTE